MTSAAAPDSGIAKLRKLATRAFHMFDVSFMAGRFLPLAPIMIASRYTHDPAQLVLSLKQLQTGMFFSTIVLYAAPQVYLVKRGKESLVFAFHMMITAAALSVIFFAAQFFNSNFDVMALLFYISFRSFYLYCATRFREQAGLLSLMVLCAAADLVLYAFTWSLPLCTVAMFPIYYAILRRNDVLHVKYARAAFRKYFSILRHNIFYFFNVLYQQVYTQMFLFLYAFFSDGSVYLYAVHAVYLYLGVILFHQILVRSSITRFAVRFTARTATSEFLRKELARAQFRSIALGAFGSAVLFMLHTTIEKLAFGSAFLSDVAALLVCAMILLQSYSFAWTSLITAARRPGLLLTMNLIGTVVLIVFLIGLTMLHVPYDFLWAQIAGLSAQCIMRTYLGLSVVKTAD